MSFSQQVSALNSQIPTRYIIKNVNFVSNHPASTGYKVTGADYGVILNCTGTAGSGAGYSVNLPPAASVGAGFNCFIWNNTTVSASSYVNIVPNGNNTIDGATNIYLRRGEGTQIVSDGSNWQTMAKKTMRGYSESFDSGSTRPIATGDGSIAIGVGTNAASSYSVAIGINSQASGVAAVSLGNSGSASGAGSLCLGNGSASGDCSVSFSGSYGTGQGSFASATFSYAFGDSCLSDIIGKYVYASGAFASRGDAQFGKFVLRAASSSATPVVLTTNGASADFNNQLIVSYNSAFTFSILITARQQAAGGTLSASWKIEGLIRKEGSAASTTLVNYITTVISNVPGWTIAVSADTTNGGLAITATGAASTSIRWVAMAQTSEVTYA